MNCVSLVDLPEINPNWLGKMNLLFSKNLTLLSLRHFSNNLESDRDNEKDGNYYIQFSPNF